METKIKMEEREQDLFDIDIRLLERFLTRWEAQHVQEHGTLACEDFRCSFYYNTALNAYMIRVMDLKHTRTMDVLIFEKLNTVENRQEGTIFRIKGQVVRRCSVGDYLVLWDDYPGINCRYRIKAISWKESVNNVSDFVADVEFIEFEQDSINN